MSGGVEGARPRDIFFLKTERENVHARRANLASILNRFLNPVLTPDLTFLEHQKGPKRAPKGPKNTREKNVHGLDLGFNNSHPRLSRRFLLGPVPNAWQQDLVPEIRNAVLQAVNVGPAELDHGVVCPSDI